MKILIFFEKLALVLVCSSFFLSFTSCKKDFNKKRIDNSKGLELQATQFFWCSVFTDTNESYMKVIEDLDSIHMVDWRFTENGELLFHQYAGILCSDIDSISAFDVTDSSFCIKSGEVVLTFKNTITNDSVSSADVFLDGLKAHVMLPTVDSLGLMALAAHLNNESKGIKPPWKYPVNPWTVAVAVIRYVKWILDHMPPECKEMYRIAISCQMRGCTPIYNFSECSCKCRKYVGTPEECNCNDF